MVSRQGHLGLTPVPTGLTVTLRAVGRQGDGRMLNDPQRMHEVTRVTFHASSCMLASPSHLPLFLDLTYLATRLCILILHTGSRIGRPLCPPCLSPILSRLVMWVLCHRPHTRMAPGSTSKASANGAGGHVHGSIDRALEAGADGGRSGRGPATQRGYPWRAARMAKVGDAVSTVGAGGRWTTAGE